MKRNHRPSGFFNPQGRPYIASRGAFTLLELLAVIAIVGILAAILIPTIGSVRQSARASTCASNLRQIGAAVHLFVADNKGILPGKGKRTPTASATWQDVLNALVFESNATTLQRMGDTPVAGQMYCPSMEPFGTATRYPRAYTLNANTMDYNTTTNPPMAWGVFIEYQKAFPYNQFSAPARCVLISESERDGDTAQPTAPLGQIVMGNGTSAPAWSANSLTFAFRHNNRMNVLFMDGHVQSFSPSEAAAINSSAYFSASGR